MSKNTVAEQPKIEMLNKVSPDVVSEAIKAAGCAVMATDKDGVTWLHSASHGIGFQVLWGNKVADNEYADFTLSCPLRVQGGNLPVDILNEWHRTKRFARVAQHGDFIVLEMDVIVAGGVSPAALDVSMQLWTQMMGQFFLYLRNFKTDGNESADVAKSDAPVEKKTEAVSV